MKPGFCRLKNSVGGRFEIASRGPRASSKTRGTVSVCDFSLQLSNYVALRLSSAPQPSLIELQTSKHAHKKKIRFLRTCPFLILKKHLTNGASPLFLIYNGYFWATHQDLYGANLHEDGPTRLD